MARLSALVESMVQGGVAPLGAPVLPTAPFGAETGQSPNDPMQALFDFANDMLPTGSISHTAASQIDMRPQQLLLDPLVETPGWAPLAQSAPNGPAGTSGPGWPSQAGGSQGQASGKVRIHPL